MTIDRDVYEAAVHLSRTSGQRLGQILSELARRGLTKSRPRAQHGKRRFPVFDVPANAPVIPASRVQKAIDEEGIF